MTNITSAIVSSRNDFGFLASTCYFWVVSYNFVLWVGQKKDKMWDKQIARSMEMGLKWALTIALS